MEAIKIIRGLGPLDARSIGRDALFRWMALLPLFVALSARLIVPAVVMRAELVFGINVAPYVPLVISHALLLITPSMIGLVVGFLLLDQRDDGTLMALRVTPLPLTSYLAYRLLMPMVVGVLMTLIAFPIAGLTTISIGHLIAAALVAAPLGPLMALTLAAFGENKVQGFALMKATSLLLIAPLGAYGVPDRWHLAFGILPTYWPAQLLWSLQDGDPYAWLYAIAGLSYQILLLVALLRHFYARLATNT